MRPTHEKPTKARILVDIEVLVIAAVTTLLLAASATKCTSGLKQHLPGSMFLGCLFADP